MEDKRKYNGGNKTAGRKPKVEEEKVNNLFVNALKELYKTETDDAAKILFIKDKLLDSQRGDKIYSEFMTEDELHYLNGNIKECHVYMGNHSEIAFIIKK